ncbi:hypothetical protein BC940DRAFT_315870 [Gongronella butleri]|nr:hypothetical protein BC940DRAFT_315870 [Gongronella butleri]
MAKRRRVQVNPSLRRTTRSMTATETATERVKVESRSAQQQQQALVVAAAAAVPEKIPLQPETYQELWMLIFQHVGLRDLIELSHTCRAFHRFVPYLHVWLEVLEKAKQKVKSRSAPMTQAMAVQRKRGICEECLGSGPPSGSKGVVSMTFADKTKPSRHLCLSCRRKIIDTNRRAEPKMKLNLADRICKSRTQGQLFFNPDQYRLPFIEARNPHSRYFSPMILYDSKQVVSTMLRHHGGYCGLRAEKKRSAHMANKREENKRKKQQQKKKEREEAGPSTSAPNVALPTPHPPPAPSIGLVELVTNALNAEAPQPGASGAAGAVSAMPAPAFYANYPQPIAIMPATQ